MSAYVGIKACGCAVAASVIAPPLNVAGADLVDFAIEQAKEIRRWRRDGLEVRVESVGWVRANLRRCQCS